MYGTKEQENSCVGRVLSPKLHRVFFCIFIITSLKSLLRQFVFPYISFVSLYLILGVSQFRQTSRNRDLMLVVCHHDIASLSSGELLNRVSHHNYFVYVFL